VQSLYQEINLVLYRIQLIVAVSLLVRSSTSKPMTNMSRLTSYRVNPLLNRLTVAFEISIKCKRVFLADILVENIENNGVKSVMVNRHTAGYKI
jgi:hypothetical protein